jgi:hypothetical protein
LPCRMRSLTRRRLARLRMDWSHSRCSRARAMLH